MRLRAVHRIRSAGRGHRHGHGRPDPDPANTAAHCATDPRADTEDHAAAARADAASNQSGADAAAAKLDARPVGRALGHRRRRESESERERGSLACRVTRTHDLPCGLCGRGAHADGHPR